MGRVDFNKVCKDYGIRVCSFQSMADQLEKIGLDLQKSSGYAFIRNDQPVILFDKNRPIEEVRFTIAHELGHILLGHLSYRNQNEGIPKCYEQEADAFAAALIANDIICRYG